MKAYIYALSASTAMLTPAAAFAQTTQSDTVVETVDRSPADGEIIVTATKRSERLQDVPVSVSVVTPQALTDAGVLSTTQLPTLVPGLSFGDIGQPKLTQFVVRGVGTYALTVSLEPSVGVAVDGVPLARVDGALTDLVDVERVEVLKGPQGMLFGKNATAGLIGVVTKKPEFGDTSFTGHLSYGSYNELNADATVNFAMGDAGAARLTAWRFARDGFVRASKSSDTNDYYDKNTYGVRLSVAVRPTDNLQLTLIGQYDGRDENGPAITDRLYVPGVSLPFLVAWKDSIGIDPSEKNRVADINFPGFIKGDNFAVTGIADLDLGGGYTLSSTTSYRSVESSSSVDPFATSSPLLNATALTVDDKYEQFTQELRIASDPSKRLSFVAGLFYYDFQIKDITTAGLVGLPAPGVSRVGYVAPITNYMKNYAAFGEAKFRLFPNVQLIAGIRQSHDRTGGSVERIARGVTVEPVAPSFRPFSFVATPIKYDFTSYRVGAQIDVADDVMVYATASRGYKAPGFNLTAQLTAADLLTNGLPNNARVDAETVKSYEVGFKSQFFDRRLTFNVTAFHSIFSDFQTTVTPPGAPGFVIRNAEELKSSGVEVELSARPIDGLSLGINGAYINARYTDFANANCYAGQPGAPTPPAGTPLEPGFCYGRALPFVQGIQSLNGARVANAPKWSFNARARYDAALSSDWRAYISADYADRSKTLFENVNDPLHFQEPYGVTNFNIGFGPESGKWEISAYLRNAFKVHHVARVREQLGTYQNVLSYNALRRVGVQLEVKF